MTITKSMGTMPRMTMTATMHYGAAVKKWLTFTNNFSMDFDHRVPNFWTKAVLTAPKINSDENISKGLSLISNFSRYSYILWLILSLINWSFSNICKHPLAQLDGIKYLKSFLTVQTRVWQLKRWPWHWVTHWITELFTFWF